jgi:hypothetical protein
LTIQVITPKTTIFLQVSSTFHQVSSIFQSRARWARTSCATRCPSSRRARARRARRARCHWLAGNGRHWDLRWVSRWAKNWPATSEVFLGKGELLTVMVFLRCGCWFLICLKVILENVEESNGWTVVFWNSTTF